MKKHKEISVLSSLTRRELMDVMYYYNLYIQEANDFDKYQDGYYPVCIEEFYQNDYDEWKKNDI